MSILLLPADKEHNVKSLTRQTKSASFPHADFTEETKKQVKPYRRFQSQGQVQGPYITLLSCQV